MKITELVFLLDKSGSMRGLEDDTIGGFNALIEEQRAKLKEDSKCFVSTVLFDHGTQVLHDRVDIKDVKTLTDNDYKVGGSTALLDAFGGAIHHIGNIHKYIRPEDVPEKTMFVITTDGQENASHIYSKSKVKEMVTREQEEYGWEFLFLGANMDAINEAAKYGIRKDRAVTYENDSEGVRENYRSVSCAISAYCEDLPLDNWDKDIIKHREKKRNAQKIKEKENK